ncbi:secreted protein of Ly-6 domain 1-like [Podarcis raffonei]|uniref:secreted protein of Ly-6 domain 1-like n=1 Tax=Podarcis raffonei TaxID=65483 RepID=UPI00232906A1|nr:secreted protein of Ly-6 domain 1-like [Podarcis raffonei]
MKTKVNKVLVFGFSMMLTLAAVAGLRCHSCQRVNGANLCAVPQRQCQTDGFCYTRRLFRGGAIRRVYRGCSKICRQLVNIKKSTRVSNFCCEEDFCNVHNVWV